MNERAASAVRATIFLVDDDAAFRAVARAVLGQVGEVRTFEHANEALEEAEKGPPDLVITDLVMEELGGFEFLRRYTERFEDRRTPFLFVSALGDDETLTQCLDAGADDYVAKPVSPSVLRARAWALLRRSGSFDRSAVQEATSRRSVRLSTVPVNGHPLAIETRFVREPAPEIVTIVRAGQREVVRNAVPVDAGLDASAIEQLRKRLHGEAESAMRDKVSALRYQQLRDQQMQDQMQDPMRDPMRERSGLHGRAEDESPAEERLFDEGVDHALHARWAEALGCWERALERDPDNAALRCNVEVARRKLAG